MNDDERQREIRASWDANAAAWTAAVRKKLIASRTAGTDAAILEACTRLRPRRTLDVGCGEGWLVRALAARGGEVLGIDASAELIASARAAGGGQFEVLDYESLVADPARAAGPWDAIVCNYSLFGERLARLLAALARRLGPAGRLLIQTVHPLIAAGDGPYEPGWRTEDFAAFGVPFRASMPWYFRTLSSWAEELRQAGLVIVRIEEPSNAGTGKPLSLIFECAASARVV